MKNISTEVKALSINDTDSEDKGPDTSAEEIMLANIYEKLQRDSNLVRLVYHFLSQNT